MRVRALEPADAEPVAALVRDSLAGTRYEMRTMEIVACALDSASGECQGLVALGPREDLRGVLVHGPLAGADTVEKLHLLTGTSDALDALITALAAARGRLVRMIVCELPSDLPFEPASRALERASYRREGTVEGVFTSSVALEIYVLRSRGE